VFAHAQTAENLTQDRFPEKSVWMNLDYKLALENLFQKVTIVVVSDERCVECGYYLRQLEAVCQKTPALQLIEVMAADSTNSLSRRHLLNYIQRNNFQHPIAVFPDLNGFQDVRITAAPYFLLYEKGVRTITQGGHDGFVALTQRIEQLKEDGELFKSCMMHQFRSYTEPTSYANPLIETPSYMAFEDGGDLIFVNDAAHNRMVAFNEDGSVAHLIGSTLSGYTDESYFVSQFNRPSGMVHAEGKLFIADTYNHRIRVIDFTSEQVSSLVGSGFITWKKVKAIDARYEPLGLPIDVAVLGNQLYVISASTNQLYEVDMKDGATRLFCDLPESQTGMLRSCPINMNAGAAHLYVTMADGKIFKVDRKGKINEIKKPKEFRFTSVCEWKDGIAGVTRDGKVCYQPEDKDWTVVGEQVSEGVKANQVKLSSPTDVMVKDGDLYLLDSDNHLIRMLGSPSDKLMKNFWFKPSQELVGFDPAHTGADLVQMDSVYVGGSSPLKLHVLLDLEGYKIVPAGQNELILGDGSGQLKLDTEQPKKEEFTITIDPKYANPDIYLEVYLTLEHPENKGLFLIKRAYLDFPVVPSDNPENLQEQIYKPILLPN
jgi:sugar lactone lactonase YvrE